MEALIVFICGNILLLLMYYILSTKSSKISNRLLQHQYVLVTGCDTGFGRAIVEKLDRIGVHVFAGCLTHSAVEELKSQSSRIIPFVMDVTKTADIEKAVTLVKKELPEGRGLWGIVNNAGVGAQGLIEWISVERFRRACQVNLFGLIDVTCHFLPLIKKEKGRIVNMASLAGVIAVPRIAAYSVTKFGVVAFNNALRIEMMAFNVGVHCICPTFFATEILNMDRTAREVNAQYDQASPEVKKSYEGVVEQLIDGSKIVSSKAPTDLSPVVNAVENALFSLQPKRFYYVGKNALLYRIIAICPSVVADWFTCTFNPSFRPSMIKSS